MLIFVKPVFLLIHIGSDPGLNVEIVIQTLNIGKSVVIDSVLLLPDKSAAAHQIKCSCENSVDCGMGRKAAMAGIVHYIEAYTGKGQTNHCPKDKIDPYRKPCKEQC